MPEAFFVQMMGKFKVKVEPGQCQAHVKKEQTGNPDVMKKEQDDQDSQGQHEDLGGGAYGTTSGSY